MKRAKIVISIEGCECIKLMRVRGGAGGRGGRGRGKVSTTYTIFHPPFSTNVEENVRFALKNRTEIYLCNSAVIEVVPDT